MAEWIVVLAILVAFTLGVFVGIRHERAAMRAAVRELAGAGWKPTLTPDPDAPLDHDAAFRVLKEWGHR